MVFLQEAEGEDDRAEHQHADEFYQCADLRAHRAHRYGRGQHLRHSIDAEPGDDAILPLADPEERKSERQQQDDEDAERGGKGDGGGYIFGRGADDGRRRHDGGIAANGIAAGNERRKAGIEPQCAANAIAEGQGDNDDQHDGRDHHGADLQHGTGADRAAEEDHGHFKHGFRRQIDPGTKARGEPEKAVHGDPGDDCHDEPIENDPAEKASLKALRKKSEHSDANG